MKILTQIGIVLGVCLVGEGISFLLPFPFPGSVIGMILLFLLLFLGILRPDHIAQKSDFLLKNMAFFFIPAGVGILESFGALRGRFLILIGICALTTLLTFAASAFTVRGVMALQAALERRRKE